MIPMELRAVLFDYGEVLSGPPNPQAHSNLLEIAGLPEAVFEQHYWAIRLDYDADIYNGRSYWSEVARRAGVEFTPAQIDRLLEQDARMWMDVNPQMLAWARALKQAGLKLGILSNMGDAVLQAIEREFSWLGLFDQLTWSYQTGMVKPDPAIYRYTVERLGVAPGEILFVDNLEKNCAAAEQCGLEAIVYSNVEQLDRDLRGRGYRLPYPLPNPWSAARGAQVTL
jgi:putative hydrolase of the HAD superfamily